MVFAIWLPLLIGLSAISGALKTDYHTDFTQPDSESKQVQDAFARAGDKTADGIPAQIVFRAPQGIQDAAVKDAMSSFFADVAKMDGVRVTSPYDELGAAQISATAPIAFADISVGKRTQTEFMALADDIQARGDQVDVPGVTIEYGGQIFNAIKFPESELLGLLAAVIILLIAFGSVLAMGLPIGTAIFGLGVSIGLIGIASHGFSMPDFAPQMAAMIGLGVGIDYALFIVSRYREGLHNGMDPETAVMASIDSSGRAVLFAGITVIISLLGLMAMGLAFVNGLAISGAVAVLVMMVAALTLLPALLGFAGTKIDNTTRAAGIAVGVFVTIALIGVFSKKLGPLLGLATLLAVLIMLAGYLPFGHALRQPMKHRVQKPRDQRFWYRWSRVVQRHPWPAFFGGAIALLLLAAPLLSIDLGFTDAGVLKTDQTTRRAYDLIAEGFGPGFSGPLALISDDPAMTPEIAANVDAVLKTDSGIAFATPGRQLAGADGTPVSPATWSWVVFPTTSAQDGETRDLVQRLRGDTLDNVGAAVLVGGFTAGGIDFSTYIAGRLPVLIGAVLILSFLLLMCVFRSLLVPLKAVIMNLLSIGAAYGVIVAVFQWGWGKGLIGVEQTGPIEPWVPMMLFAIVFGLSMDYEVFLLSRMKEEFIRTGDNATAVADGLAATARVITAAALIMVCVFSAFVLGDDRNLKLFGLGLAAAVFVDATLVRMVLVPATMELLGDKNWWFPKSLDRFLPKLNVEGHQEPEPEEDKESVLV
ncbi:MAG TPA: MMPL family transporter [Ilumatobacteraceae bacterium]|nr:MMPL family transporter [Ilumatobacteraceae bacterium]